MKIWEIMETATEKRSSEIPPNYGAVSSDEVTDSNMNTYAFHVNLAC